MKRLGPRISPFPTCADCPLDIKLQDSGSMFRSDVGGMVRRISTEIDSSQHGLALLGEVSEAAQRIANHYEAQEVIKEVLACAYLRRIGGCVVSQMSG